VLPHRALSLVSELVYRKSGTWTWAGAGAEAITTSKKIILSLLIGVVGTAFVVACVYATWAIVSRAMIERAGAAPAPAGAAVIWRDPGEVERLDFREGPGGPGGAPAPPFHFVEEKPGSTSPKVYVTDARGRRWQLKFGSGVRSEPFAARIAWAAGYFVEPSYFLAGGRIDGVPALEHAGDFVGADGTFAEARFELEDERVHEIGDEHSWAWDTNPFVGTRELAGLKIVSMLVSNWDDKDVRDVARGSNTAILEIPLPGGGYESRYLVSDWGGSMGRWGELPLLRSKWDCEGYAAQSAELVSGVENGIVAWGYRGQRTGDLSRSITVEEVRWVNGYLGRISDAQLREGLAACGASPDEVECFARAIRARLDQLARV
jgi:hypothetical protein